MKSMNLESSASRDTNATSLEKDISSLLLKTANVVRRWMISHYGEYPYDAHTWVEVTGGEKWFYIDVTADQFNYGMDPETQFNGVIIQQGYPHGVSQELPEEE